MKKTFKGLFIVAFAFVLLLSLTGCGEQKENNNGGTKGNTTSGTKLENINTSNWAQVVEDNFGLKVSLPSGWTVSAATSPNKVTNVEIKFTKGGDTTFEAFGEQIFAELKADAVGDITKYADKSIIYNSFTDANRSGIVSMNAVVDAEKSRNLTVQCYDGNIVQLSLLRSWIK